MHWSGQWHQQSQAARSVLEQLYTDGVLLIHHKSGSRKYYDLTEKYFDHALLNAENPCSDEEAFLRWRINRRIGAIGMLWNRRSDALLGIQMTTEQRNQAYEKLESEGTIVPVQVDGIKGKLYIQFEDMRLMNDVLNGAIDTKARLEFIAPLDPMLWDRKLIKSIFDYQYSWEIYTPAANRKYGYYVLPILFGERFIGRIEATVDRKRGTLFVKNIWYETGVEQTHGLKDNIHRAINRLAKFNDCEKIKVED